MRGGRTCKTNVLICIAERVQGYNGIKHDKPYTRNLSVGWGERTCVKKLASLNGMPNHPSKIVLQERYNGSGTGRRGSTTELDIVRISSGCCCTHDLNLG